MISRNDILRALTRGYGHELNRRAPSLSPLAAIPPSVCIDLIDAMTDEVMVAISTELQRNEFYRTISINKGSQRQ